MKKTFILAAIILCAGFGAAARAEESTRRPADKRDRVTPTAARVVRVGPRTTYLKEGLSTEDVLRMVGRPSDVFERFEDGRSVMVYVFERGENRVLVAEFVGGRLVRSRIESRAEGERAESVNF
jgi:hypothetical protein